MKKFNVIGMSCAACQTKVEKAVSKVPGVTECAVSLLTNSMGVEGTADVKAIIKAVENAGYKATSLDNNNSNASTSTEQAVFDNTETSNLIRRLSFSVGFLLLLMYVSMGHMMFGWPLPKNLMHNHVAMGLIQLILSAIIMLINKKFFISGTKSLLHGSPNMDTLVSLGSGTSFVYSTAVLFQMTDAVMKNDSLRISQCMDNLYFEGAAMILTLITVGKLLESVSKGKTTNALKSLINLTPKTANIIKDENEETVPVETVLPGDIFIVRPGESIPVDGIVLEGNSAVNEAALTGESVPVEKEEGSTVSAATMNTSGFLKCKATRTGQDTTLAQIIKLVSDAAATKAPIAKIADKVSGVFVPSVILLAVITFAVWMICGSAFSFALSKGIAILVVSCPCALGLATPVAIMVGNGIGAKNGILFKTSAALEAAGKTQIIALDKTGTITKGQMEVVDISCENQEELLSIAGSLESFSEHPVAKAVVQYCEKENISFIPLTDFSSIGGKGVQAYGQNGEIILGGNLSFIKDNCPDLITESLIAKLDDFSKKGHTPLLFVKKLTQKNELLGIISVADTIKEESSKAITELKNMGIKVVMLTGDNKITAQTIADQAGVDEVIAEVLPDGKEEVIRQLQMNGKVTMVGDGINDAPALTRADIGIAIGAGTDVAIDSADIVLVKSRLDDIPKAIRLSRRTLKNIRENLFWAFLYNVALIPVAAGAYYHLFNIQMNPMLGALAMSLSSFSVVTNALRLNLININSAKHDKKIKQLNHNKEKTMERTLKVEGMMCTHCEAHVKEALEAIKGVTEAVPNHTSGEVKVTMDKEVKDSAFEKAITKAGYKFLG